MMAPWPTMRRGTECSVPIVPGFVSEIVVPWKSDGLERVVPRPPHHVVVRRPEPREVQGLRVLDIGDQELARAVGPHDVDRDSHVDVRRGHDEWLVVFDGVRRRSWPGTSTSASMSA